MKLNGRIHFKNIYLPQDENLLMNIKENAKDFKAEIFGFFLHFII